MNPEWKNLKRGDRVELVACADPYTELAPGTRGIMLADVEPEPQGGVDIRTEDGRIVSEYTVLSIKWDNGSWLHVIPEAGDSVKPVDADHTCPKCSKSEDVTPLEFTEKPEGGWWRCSGCDHKFQHRVVTAKIA